MCSMRLYASIINIFINISLISIRIELLDLPHWALLNSLFINNIIAYIHEDMIVWYMKNFIKKNRKLSLKWMKNAEWIIAILNLWLFCLEIDNWSKQLFVHKFYSFLTWSQIFDMWITLVSCDLWLYDL